MARDPGSQWHPLAEWTTQGSYPKDKFIVHSTGDDGSALAVYNYFNRPEVVVESTFIVGKTPADPTLQLLDSSAAADANILANQSGISVECVGTGDEQFTDWQVSELIRLGKWARQVHNIPPQQIPTQSGAGFGWHVMFGAPGPWTSVAKVCPGALRIEQLRTVVFPAIYGAAATKPAPLPKPAVPAFPLPRSDYFGLITGPAQSHGGFYPSERPWIRLLQGALIRKGYVPGIKNPLTTSWDDGIFGQPTKDAVSRFQHAEMPGTKFYGQVWADDWAKLLA